MTRLLFLSGYAAVGVAAVVLQVVALQSRRVVTIGSLVRNVTRTTLGRAVVLSGWLWLGWHLFVRARHG